MALPIPALVAGVAGAYGGYKLSGMLDSVINPTGNQTVSYAVFVGVAAVSGFAGYKVARMLKR